MSTYTQLQADVNEVATRTVSTLAYTSLTAELNARLRLTLMEEVETFATTIGGQGRPTPTGFLEARSMQVDDLPRTPVVITDQYQLNSSYSGSGRPTEVAVVDGAFIFNPTPDAVYDISVWYIKALDDLSGGSDTNDVMDNHYNIYLYGALKHHTALTRNLEMTAHWGGMFEEAIKQAELADARKLYGAESLAIAPPQRGG